MFMSADSKDSGKEIEFGLTSTEEDNLLAAKDMLKADMAEIDGVINIKDNMPPGRFEVYLNMRPQAEVYGITKMNCLPKLGLDSLDKRLNESLLERTN